jgi:hypothetical protein
MKIRFNKVIGIILAILILFSALVACGSDKTESKIDGDITASETAVTVENSEESSVIDYFEGLPENNYNDYEFRFLVRNMDRWMTDIAVFEVNGEIINDAVYERTLNISEKYGLVFKLIKSSNDNYETDGMNSIIAGDDAYDVIAAHPRAAAVYGNAKLCLDWNSDIPYLSLDNEWWDQDCRANLSINHKLYTMTGDLSWCSMGAANAMLFNKVLFDKYSLKAPYQDVLDSKWTFDKFEELVKNCTADLNGDGIIDYQNDQLGYVTHKWVGPVQSLYVAGERVMTKDENDMPVLSLYNETSQKVFDWFFGILDSDYAWCQTDGNSWEDGFTNVFMEGRSLFIDLNMSDINKMREMDDDFGIIPWPKKDENSDYCTNVDACTNLFIIPITNSDTERTGIVLETMCRIGADKIIPAYYELVLQTKYTRDRESVDMLDIIKKARVFDIGYYNAELGGQFANQFADFAGNKNRDLASWYNKNESKVLANMDKITSNYMD